MTGARDSGAAEGGGSTSGQRERVELVTATGWRLVGPATQLVSEAAVAGLAAPTRDDDLLYAAHFLLRPRLGTTVVPNALAALNTALSKVRRDERPLDRSAPVTEVVGRFHALHWQVAESGDRWVGELLWRHPHAAVKGIAVTTHVVLSEQPGAATMTVRVGVAGGVAAVHGLVGAGQAHPAFPAEVNRTVRLVFDGADGTPRPLGETDIEPFVRNVLLAEDRAHPVAVLSPTERGDYLVPPSLLAEELLGLAHLYVLDRHPTTFRLSDALGDRRLSCYWGALRLYLPEFSCADAPETHPLFVDDRIVDPVVRAQLRGMLGRAARHRVPTPAGVDAVLGAAEPKAEQPTAKRTQGPEPAERATLLAPPMSDRRDGGEPWRSVERYLADLSTALGRLVELNTSLLDELARLRTTNAVRGATAAGLERRLAGLERFLRARLAPPVGEPDEDGDEAARLPDHDPPPDDAPEITLAAAVRRAAVTHADDLLILDDAERAAEDSPYADVDRAAAVLDAMALVARRRQAGTLGMSLREAFRELGVDYRHGIGTSTPDRLRRQYTARLPTGEVVDCEEHIALGATYDPRYCLRIYFTSRAPAEPRLVIAHVGRHRDGLTTT
jgi:hypothetical protein